MELMIRTLEVLGLSSCDWTPLPRKEVNGLVERWKKHFAPEVRARHDRWAHSQFLWHAFSRKEATHLSAAKAQVEYEKQDEKFFYLILVPSYGAPCAILLSDCVSPNRNSIQAAVHEVLKAGDLYVVSATFAWTFVETHEGDDSGPFFAYDAESL